MAIESITTPKIRHHRKVKQIALTLVYQLIGDIVRFGVIIISYPNNENFPYKGCKNASVDLKILMALIATTGGSS